MALIIFKIESIEFADGLTMGYEGKRGVKNNSQCFGLELLFVEEQFGRQLKNLEMLSRHWIFKTKFQERG